MNGGLSSVSGAFLSASVSLMSASREKKVVFDTREATELWGGSTAALIVHSNVY